MSDHQEEDIASNALAILSATNSWLLMRHECLLDNMRCALTGESAQLHTQLKTFNDLVPKHINLPDNLMNSFVEMKASLEESWLETTKAIHPMSGLPILEQVNNFQALAGNFMRTAKEANQHLLNEFAMRDSLTGARTRLTMSSSLAQEIKNTAHLGTASTIALLDHDDFKEINDKWGHTTGDRVMATVANIIQDNLRLHDKLFRYGGDEWLIIMPGTTIEIAKKILARIQQACESHQFKASNAEPFNTYFSYGIAESLPQLTPVEWIAMADKQLYKHKTANQNQLAAAVG